MKPYEKYKDSGVEWLGNIPSSWNILRFKRLAKIRNGKDQKEILIEEGGYPVLGTGGEFGRVSEFIYDKPSVLLGRKGTVNKPQFIEEPFWTVDTLFYTEIYNGIFPRYLFYLSQQMPFDFLQESSAVPSMTQEKLNSVKVCKPTLQEQTAIAKYLDHQTAIIDELIEKKTKQIALLKEKRQAIINETVTKGLDPTSKMKDSGIEWLGEIPESWEVIKLKWHLNFLNYKRIPIESGIRFERQGNYPYYGASGIIDYVDDYIFEGKYILIGEDGANILSRSTPLAFIAEGKFWVNNHAHILEVLGGNVDYFCYQIESNDFTPLATGSAQPKLTKDAVANIKVIVPPLIEQNVIVDFINNCSSSIDSIVDKIYTQIEKLKEYRQSLISEAVTGKIDVRGWGK